jgi:hypothetical protein
VWDMLRALGCDDAQGFYMSKPLEPVELARWMRANDGVLAGLKAKALSAPDEATSRTGRFAR